MGLQKAFETETKMSYPEEKRLFYLLGQTLTSLHDHPYIFFLKARVHSKLKSSSMLQRHYHLKRKKMRVLERREKEPFLCVGEVEGMCEEQRKADDLLNLVPGWDSSVNKAEDCLCFTLQTMQVWSASGYKVGEKNQGTRRKQRCI